LKGGDNEKKINRYKTDVLPKMWKLVYKEMLSHKPVKGGTQAIIGVLEMRNECTISWEKWK
jgi:hypothetical protein